MNKDAPESPFSPREMANAALEDARRERDKKRSNQEQSASQESGLITRCSGGNEEEKLEDLWDKDNANLEMVIKSSASILGGAVDDLVQIGLDAFLDLENSKRNVSSLEHMIELRGRELQRSQKCEAQHRESIANFLRALEASKSAIHDAAKASQTEAQLRGDITSLQHERDNALQAASDWKRKHDLVSNELDVTKTKLNRIMSEKYRLEREARAATSLTRASQQERS